MPGPQPHLTDQTCSTCPNRLTANDVSHGNKRCRQCRVSHPRTFVKREEPFTTQDSVWLSAGRDNFTELMAKHFEGRRPGITAFTEFEKAGKRLLKRQRAES